MREFVVAKTRRDDESDRRTSHAWMVASLTRAKKLPELKSLLVKRKTKQTPQQMTSVLNQIAGAYGLKMRKGKPRG